MTLKETIPEIELDSQDEVALEQLGYQQELKRSFSLMGMIGFSFSIVTCWSALAGVLIVGAESGGPPVMIWSWIGISVITLAVAYSMAEMCSAYPLAGGQYTWAGLLAPARYSRAFSYVCGWFMLVGIVAVGATNNFVVANYILGLANLNYQAYIIQRWHTVLLTYAISFFALAYNVWTPRLLDKVSQSLLVWNLLAFVIIVITILATNDHKQSASFVFFDFVNLTGFSPAYTAVIGLLQTAFGMCCYDAPAHMVEEIQHARKIAPRAIVLSVYVGAISGLIFLVAVCFCIGSIQQTAVSSTGVPLIQIFHDSTSSVAGASCLTALILVVAIGGSMGLTAEGGRAVYAFARDGGLPFSSLWRRIEPKHAVPTHALCLVAVVQMALTSIYFGTVTGFQTVVSIATEGFYISYALPLLARLVAFCLPSSRSHALYAMRAAGGTYDLGWFSIPLNLVGLLFLTLLTVTFNFPSVAPVTSGNMNYTSAAVGAIMLVAGLTWITTAKKAFRSPAALRDQRQVVEDVEDVVIIRGMNERTNRWMEPKHDRLEDDQTTAPSS